MKHWLLIGLSFQVLAICLCQAVILEDFPSSGSIPASTNSLRHELLQAVSSNDASRARAILKTAPALANATNDMREPLLVQAARQGNVELVEALLDAGAAINASGARRNTALDTVVRPMLFYRGVMRIGDRSPLGREAGLAMAQVLLGRGASIFSTNGYGQTLLGMVQLSGDADLADLLLTHQHRREARDGEGNSVVHLAALWGRTNTLKILAEEKANLEATNAAGLTPLQTIARVAPSSGMIFDGWMRSDLGGEGRKLRQTTAGLLIALGASRDVFSATALGWNNTVAELLTNQPELARTQDATGQTPLHWAAEFGEVEIARLLRESGASVEAADRQGQTPLDVAARNARTDLAGLLVKSGASVTRPQGSKAPLHWAAEQGNVALLEVLFNAGADLNAEDGQGQTPLDLAAGRNQTGVVKWLLARQARLRKGGGNRTIPLHWAAAHANTNLISLLLEQGSDINARNEEGKTPLHLAHEKDNFILLEFLLARGANINARDTNGNTVLHVRAAAGNDRFAAPPRLTGRLVDKALAVPAVKKWVPPALVPKPPMRSMMWFLLARGAQATLTNACGETPLHRVAAKSFPGTNVMQEARNWMGPLLSWHAKLDARDAAGRTPLHLATQAKNRPVMEALIAAGAKVTVGDNAGATPLHLVCGMLEESEAAVPDAEVLLKAGADVNARNKAGATPLHVALAHREHTDVYENRPKLVALLVRAGANVNAVDMGKHTPLLLVSASSIPTAVLWQRKWVLPGDSEPTELWHGGWESPVAEPVASLLLASGASVNVADGEGNTPLHYAAQHLRTKLAKMLLAHGAARNARNRQGKTPLDIAYEAAGGFEMIPLLQATNLSGEIALAAVRDDLPMVKAFLRDDPHSPERPWMFGATALQWACARGRQDVVELLLKYGAATDPPKHVRDQQARTVEFNALRNTLMVESNRFWNAERAGGLRESAPVPDRPETADTKEGEGSLPETARAYLTLTPLQLSLAGGHTNIARLLIRHGAKIDLASAASLGLVDVLERAIRSEPQRVNEFSRRATWRYESHGPRFVWNPAVDEQTGTLLHFAVRGGKQETVGFLLDAGANPAAPDDGGRTPFQLAVEEGQEAIVTLLKQHGAEGRQSAN